MRILLDTGPLVALLNRRDAFHAWAVEESAKLKPPFLTCEAVLAEALFLLSEIPNGRERLIALLDTDRIELSFSYQKHRSRMHELLDRYKNIPISFADASLICMAKEKQSTVFTLDNDFRIYRLHRNQPIRVIMP